MDAAAYSVVAAINLAGINMTRGGPGVAYCLGCAALFGCAAATAARGPGRGYTPSRRAGLVAGLGVFVGGLHNTVLALSTGFRRVPASAVTRPLTFFWATRFGPALVLLLNLAAGFPRGRGLLVLLTAQAAVAAVTTPAGCRQSVVAYEVLPGLFVRLVDVWGAGWRAALASVLGGGGEAGAGPAGGGLPPFSCCDHACRQVTLGLYALVAGLSWAVAPAPPGARRPRLGGWWVPVAVAAAAAWVGLPWALPRPAGCGPPSSHAA
jgi:hypothetical protein